MANYITTDTELTSIANAIRTKGGTSASLSYPTGFVSAIEGIQTGGGSSGGTGFDVLFYDDLANDCNGGVVYHYSAVEFAALTAMPANPGHSNFTTHGFSIPMTSQGWNWSLADAKTYVAKYGKLNIGQTYIPTDGKSHYICYVPEDAPVERWNTEIDISVSGGSVNWQVDDGTISTASGNITATFPSVGWHDVKIDAPSGVTYYPYSVSSKSNELKGKIQKIIQVFCGNNVTQIGDNALSYCHSLTSFTIPDGITSIGASAFYYCYSLTSLTILDSVTSISTQAFSSCYRLTSITIPDGVTSIGNSTFNYCYSLTSLTIPDSVTSIGDKAFGYCFSLTSLTIPDGITSISSQAFTSCYSLTSFTIPDDVTSIGVNAFDTCVSLASITIPDSVTSIGDSAFYYCRSLTSITIPDGVTSISSSAFQGCVSLVSITIPDSITSIGGSAFQGCVSLVSITIPDGVISIGSSAFNNCYSLASLTIPDSVTSINNSAFSHCYGLKNIIMERSTPPTLANTNVFSNLMSDYTIIVPAGSRSSYISASNWSSLADHIVEASSN